MDTLVGRTRELEEIERCLTEVRSGYVALVLEGRAGFGKTALLRAAAGLAAERGFRVLWAQPAETETELSFSVAAELLGPLLDDGVADVLAPPQMRALEIALRRVDESSDPVDPLALDLAVLAALRSASADGPLLLAVDDLQWCDVPSARALEFVLRRLGVEPVVFAATTRIGDGERPYPIPAPVDRLRRVPVRPLDFEAFSILLNGRVGGLSRPMLRRLHEACEGNPLFGLEVAVLLRDEGRLAPGPAEPLPIPESATAAFAARIARLPPAARQLLLVAAAAGRPTLDLLAAASGEQAVEHTLELLTGDGLLLLEGDRIRFTHPLVAAAAYGTASTRQRRAAHALLAGLVADTEARASHLALAASGRDATAAAALERAADSAAGRGAPDAAARLLEQAAALTPESDDAEFRRRTLAAARGHHASGDRARMVDLLEPLLELAAPGPERAGVLFELARARENDARESMNAANAALLESPGPELEIAIRRFLLDLHYGLGDVEGAGGHADAALALAERHGDERLLAIAIAIASSADFFRGRRPDLDRLEQAVEIERRLGRIRPMRVRPLLIFSDHLRRMGHYERSRALDVELLAEAVAEGDEAERCEVLVGLVGLECMAGNLLAAADYAEQLLELGRQVGDLAASAVALVWLAEVLARLGRHDEALAAIDAGVRDAEEADIDVFLPGFDFVRGWIALAEGRPRDALELLDRSDDRLDAAGIRDPAYRRPPLSVAALVSLGELDEAERRLEAFAGHCREDVHVAALGFVSRYRGLLASLRGDHSGAEQWFARALALHEQAPSAYERAQTLLLLGAARRRSKRKADARAALEEADALFERVGASRWAETARAELASLGIRRGSGDELTPMERKVAELVAGGATNKEAAAALYVSPKTVEFHLRGAFRKLGVRSRTELANAVLWAASPPRDLASREAGAP